MNQLLEKHFSCNHWLLVNPELLSQFTNHFNLIPSNTLVKWKEYKNNSNHHEILVIPYLNNYCLIEGDLIDNFYKDYCKFFTKNESVAYRFKIDIWLPTMVFECYKNEKQIRYYECLLDTEQSEVKEKEYGEKLAIEDIIDLPTPVNGYDYFYYPLAVMKNLDITLGDLSKLMESACCIFEQNR